MSLQCLAIVGKANEPLYLIDSKPPKDEGSDGSPLDDENNDVFGFTAAHRQDRLSLRKEFMMHASIDSLAEALGTHTPGGRRRTGADNTKWIGLLCPMEESYIYGYVTSTNIKILAMVADSTEPNRELHLKTLFAKIHNLFVEYMLNPWSTLQTKIESKRFDQGIVDAIKVYNETYGIAWA